MSTPLSPKQTILAVPLSFATATDIEVDQIESRGIGRLKSISLSIAGATALAADLWVGAMLSFDREKATLKLFDGYLSAPQDGDNQGLVWFGDLPIDLETSFVISAYNRSGDTVDIEFTMIIERK
jgi:hypothetical protein